MHLKIYQTQPVCTFFQITKSITPKNGLVMNTFFLFSGVNNYDAYNLIRMRWIENQAICFLHTQFFLRKVCQHVGKFSYNKKMLKILSFCVKTSDTNITTPRSLWRFFQWRHQTIHVISTVAIIAKQKLIVIFAGTTKSTSFAFYTLPSIFFHWDAHVIGKLETGRMA